MKFYQYICPVLAVLCAACSSDIEDNDEIFSVTHVQSSRVWVDIHPTSQNYYIFGAVPEKDFNAYHTDRKFIEHDFDEQRALYDTVRNIFVELGQQVPPIEEVIYNKGAVSEAMEWLEPNTDYIAYMYYLNKKKKPQNKLLKRAFHTPAKPVSDIAFTVLADSTTDDTYYVVPSNLDTYLYEEVSKPELLHYFLLDTLDITEYDAAHVYYVSIMDTYYQNGFSVSEFTVRGNDTTSLKEAYKTLNDGDVFYLACVGYTTEETTQPSLYRIDYHSGTPLTITQLQDTGAGVSPEQQFSFRRTAIAGGVSVPCRVACRHRQ